MCHEVMPFIDQVDCEKMTEEGHGAASITLELLRTFAELISYADNLEDVEDKVNTVFAQLLVSGEPSTKIFKVFLKILKVVYFFSSLGSNAIASRH